MNFAGYIDHTILKPDASKEDIYKICEEAKEFNFASVCVNLYYTKFVKEYLQNTKVKVTTVVGFPLGAVTTEVKVFETQQAINNGADEIDMVINIGALKNKDYKYVKNDILQVKQVCKDKLLKVIIETCLLTNEEKKKACELSLDAGADFVKTSTGFSKGGATVEDVTLMKEVVTTKAQVKASGGIRDYKTTKLMIEAGANRIGASASVNIVTQTQAEEMGY